VGEIFLGFTAHRLRTVRCTLEYRQSRGFDDFDPLASVGKAKERQKIKMSMQEGGDFLRVSAKNTAWVLTPL
jgi:hypothetical protein